MGSGQWAMGNQIRGLYRDPENWRQVPLREVGTPGRDPKYLLLPVRLQVILLGSPLAHPLAV